MRNWFILDGVDSRDFGVYISGQGTFSSPEREYDMRPVPGRNGDIVGIETRFSNGDLTYPAFIYANFKSNLESLRAFLNSLFGYKRLEDTYHPDEFRQVVFTGPFEPNVVSRNNAGSFDISFDCKPQRFLKTGESTTTLTSTGTITNPTRFESKPLLRVYGTGNLGIGSQTITILQTDTYMDIDCEMMDAYKGTTSMNSSIQLTGYNFPTLKPGVNNISLGTGISKVEITPRWFTI